jgi:hypothetical protein
MSRREPALITHHSSLITREQRPTEALLAAVWQRQWLDGSASGGLVDSFGRRLRVVYPGRRWGGAGPDFQGAVLSLEDGSLVRGDVEVHLRAADWETHGHHRDPAYNRTVLHVVLRQAGGPNRLQDGCTVPVVELSGRLAAPLLTLAARLAEQSGEPLELACLDSADQLIRVVERAGLERFFEKAALFESELVALEPADVFYRALLVALGYSANKRACAELGELVPWALVRRLSLEPLAEERIRALLLGGAGLLPSQRGLPGRGEEAGRLERHWHALAPELVRGPLGARLWRLVAVRPENFPTRRLVGGAALLSGWAGLDAPDALLDLILELRQRPSRLALHFQAASTSEFWSWHYDFAAPTSGPRRWQIGRSRASEIVVNVLLPLGYAIGRVADRAELSAAALLAYHKLPAAAWNRVTRAMAVQLFGAAGIEQCRGAARQQGLLHLFKRWCWERRCETCPAGPRTIAG